MDHVYAGSSADTNVLWKDEANTKYFETLRDYHELVIMEVVGHDHYADLRYHSSHNVAGLPDPTEKFDFHNLLVSPGVTPYDGSNPGVSTFELGDDFVPRNLRMQFLNLDDTIGQTSVSYDSLTWNPLDFSADWGLAQLDAASLANFRK